MSDNHSQDLDYAVAAALLALIGPSTVVDVGAERGSFIALCQAHGASRVFAFEPLPRHARYLQESFRDDPGVTLVCAALSDRSGRMALNIATDADGNELDYHHCLVPVQGSESFHHASCIQVDVLTLADAVQTYAIPPIGLLKIDTDGHDLAVVTGLGEVRPRAVMAEFWLDTPASGQSPYSLQDLCAAMATMGYRRWFTCRRNGPSEWIDIGDDRSYPGDWGNAFFVGDALWPAVVTDILPRLQADAVRRLADAHAHWFAAAVEKERIIGELVKSHRPLWGLGKLFE